MPHYGYKEIEPECLNDFTKCPGRDLCERCVHDECNEKNKKQEKQP
jgi:hypothetical protein